MLLLGFIPALSIRTTFLGDTIPLPTAFIIILPPFECPIKIGFSIFNFSTAESGISIT